MNVRLYFDHNDICQASLLSADDDDFVDPVGHEHVMGFALGFGDYKIPWGYNPLGKTAMWLFCFARIVKVEA